jgi:small subunit ribosomal protein S1
MANVLNPETESITLNTELEVLEPATEQVQPLPESTSTHETADAVVAVDSPALDADAPTEPVVEPVLAEVATEVPAIPCHPCSCACC